MMKRFGVVLSILGLALVPVAVWTVTAHAQTFSRYVDKNTTINGSLYSSGKDVEVNGTIEGDVFCAGQTVDIEATVHGDVICAGVDVTINGKVDGDIRVAGSNVTIGAQVAKNATVAAQMLSLDAGATVGQDLSAFGSTLNIKGSVGRDLLADGTALTVNGPVGRNVRYEGSQLRLKSDAIVKGDVHYTSQAKADIATDAKVSGTVTQAQPQHRSKRQTFGAQLTWYLYVLGALLVLGLVMVLLFPQWLNSAAGIGLRRPGRALLAGFLGGIAIPFLAFLSAATFIGIPVAVVVLLAWGLLAALSGPITGLWLGRLILRGKVNNLMLVFLIGSVILISLYFIPLVGLLILFFAYWLGSGAAILTLYQSLPKADYRLDPKAAKRHADA